MALADAGEVDADPGRSGVVMGTGVGGLDTLEKQILVFGEKGPRRVSPRLVPMMMSNAGAAAISIRLGWHGPSETVTTACAAGAHSIGHAARLVASGRCDVAIGGAAEAGMTGVGIAAFANMTALSTSGNSRPFDLRRDGFVITEGAGALVLEDVGPGRGPRGPDLRRAGRLGQHGRRPPHHRTHPGGFGCRGLHDPGHGGRRGDARRRSATSTPTAPRRRSTTRPSRTPSSKVFGAHPPPVTSTKGITGHGLGACGAIEAVAVLLSIEHALIPPTSGYEQPDPDIHLDVVAGAARPWDPGSGPVQFLRVRRPQRLPGDRAGLSGRAGRPVGGGRSSRGSP